LREMGGNKDEGDFLESWNWRGKEGGEISPRNSTVGVEEGEGDGEETSESKCGKTIESEQ